MADDAEAWAGVLGVPAEEAAELARLAAGLGVGAAAFLRLLIRQLVGMDDDLRRFGLHSVGRWVGGRWPEDIAAAHDASGYPEDAWADGLGLPVGEAAEFARIGAAMGPKPAEVLRLMVGSVVRVDRDLRALGLDHGVAHWHRAGGQEGAEAAANYGVHGLPLDVRPSGFIWPADVPFPWSADECRAAVLGYEVRWRGDPDDVLHRLRGSWEMSGGYAFLRQT